MLTTTRLSNALLTGATKDVLLRLFTPPGSFRAAHNFPKHAPSPYELAGHPPPKQESKFKQLSRKYGWAAVGVYFGLSILDFPFCFLAVRWLGSERIVAAEEWVVDGFWGVTERAAPGARESYKAWSAHLKEQYREWRGLEKLPAEGPVEEMEVESVEAVRGQHRHYEASLGTQLALAYALHKSLIFFRLPLAASITPGIAKWLRKRGWNVGNRPKK
ncbi:hypothetical protein B0A55_10451 [Friedmanniomyces simplex]|uniref:DUF1279 domain-containing protein n=1 Tax=Friedmanniomyces simplex TaxID=329884 RepID=A0A4U0WNW1_9PEZI|nr:hypothetical protein B0A55_10451 [Friedmanniomyces simplex]